MNLEMASYIEINAVGVVMLLLLCYYARAARYGVDVRSQHHFMRMAIANIGVLVPDAMIYLLRWHASAPAMAATHFFCVLYFTLHAYFGYEWLCYSIYKLHPNLPHSRARQWVLWIPCLMNLALAVASPFTGWVYTLTAQNRYVRGPYIWASTVLTLLYWAASAVMTVREMLRKMTVRDHSVYALLLIFPLPSVIGNLLQFRLYGLSIVWICTALSLLFLFMDFQNYHISRDVMTGLYNRRQSKKQLTLEFDRLAGAGYRLFVILADIDQFKTINDRFGHLTGDEAICTAARILQDSCREKDFVARFGGDEFLMLGRIQEDSELEEILQRIDRLTREQNAGEDGYTLTFSYGCRVYGQEDCPISIDEVIGVVDREMYAMKNALE